jgi:hypothetical protein
MKIYSLAGLTPKGKQIVKKSGERWECTQQANRVSFSPNRGPWLYLVPVGEPRVAMTIRESRLESAARWVHALNDENFKVMP